MQPTHATSDMEWADERLGENRITTAYTFKELLDWSGKVALGTDFPVEKVNPIKYVLFGSRKKIHRRKTNGGVSNGECLITF